MKTIKIELTEEEILSLNWFLINFIDSKEATDFPSLIKSANELSNKLNSKLAENSEFINDPYGTERISRHKELARQHYGEGNVLVAQDHVEGQDE